MYIVVRIKNQYIILCLECVEKYNLQTDPDYMLDQTNNVSDRLAELGWMDGDDMSSVATKNDFQVGIIYVYDTIYRSNDFVVYTSNTVALVHCSDPTRCNPTIPCPLW